MSLKRLTGLNEFLKGQRPDRFSMWRKAADEGNPWAQILYGIYCEHEMGELTEADGWYRKAADQGNALAKQALAEPRSDTAKALAALTRLRIQGEARSRTSPTHSTYQDPGTKKVDEGRRQLVDIYGGGYRDLDGKYYRHGDKR
jgi:TPR repeat protein